MKNLCYLHLQNKSAKEIFKKVNNAGCIFIGEYSPETLGDYVVGTNHILPTSGSAKYSSGLGVLDFMKRISYIVKLKTDWKFSERIKIYINFLIMIFFYIINIFLRL